MTIPEKVLIVGAGQAGCQTAVSLREKGFAGRIALIGADDALPYRRPPLSKGFLGGHVAADLLWLRPEEFYREQDIELRTGTMAQRIDRRARRIQLSSGAWIDYDMLVLAIGSRHRPTAVQAGALDGVVALRTVTEAEVLRARLSSAKELVVVGGGFIGLEVASVAVEMGIGVTVLEAGNRLMGRAVTTPISGYCAEMHARRGVRIELGARPARILGEGGRAFAVETADGRRTRRRGRSPGR
jgi:3-phenylpropionate/trans-cinnamate dioxygenase ferredoxin reductase subunit